LRLLARAVTEEAKQLKMPADFAKGTYMWSRVLTSYIRGTKERKFLRDIFAPLIRQMMGDHALDLECDPAIVPPCPSVVMLMTDISAVFGGRGTTIGTTFGEETEWRDFEDGRMSRSFYAGIVYSQFTTVEGTYECFYAHYRTEYV